MNTKIYKYKYISNKPNTSRNETNRIHSNPHGRMGHFQNDKKKTKLKEKLLDKYERQSSANIYMHEHELQTYIIRRLHIPSVSLFIRLSSEKQRARDPYLVCQIVCNWGSHVHCTQYSRIHICSTENEKLW